MHTLKDAANLGFLSAIVADARFFSYNNNNHLFSKGLAKEKMADADELFHKKGVAIVTAEHAASIAEKRFVPVDWAKILANKANK